MLKSYTFISSDTSCNTYHVNDVMGMIMPAAVKADWLISVCLFKAGPSGDLDPDVFARIPV